MVKESLYAGMSAAVLSMVLKLAPEFYKAIDYLLKNGEINKEQLKESGLSVIGIGGESFIKGFFTSIITFACKSGEFGEALKNVNPTIISMTTVLAINVLKDSYDVINGKITRGQLTDNLIRNAIVSSMSLGGGVVGNVIIPIPVVGYMVGSFVGSILGTFVYNGVKNVALSFCIDTGITLFGIVKQDYVLPDEIIKNIGISTFDYEKIIIDSFEPDSFDVESYAFDTFKPNTLDIKVLRRGVIGVNIIGYA